MPRIEVAIITSWSGLENYSKRITTFSSSDPDLEIYNKYPSVSINNIILS
jgi:hypothetical protein